MMSYLTRSETQFFINYGEIIHKSCWAMCVGLAHLVYICVVSENNKVRLSKNSTWYQSWSPRSRYRRGRKRRREANDEEAYGGGAHGPNREGPMGKTPKAEKRLQAGKSVGKESEKEIVSTFSIIDFGV
jgi:hypothetical protein